MTTDDQEEPYFDPHDDAPPGATRFGDCSYYKVGAHGKVFIYVNDRWIRSAKSIAAIDRLELLTISNDVIGHIMECITIGVPLINLAMELKCSVETIKATILRAETLGYNKGVKNATN